MKSVMNTAANVASVIACIVIVVLAVPELKDRLFGPTSRASANALEPVKDLRLAIPKTTVKGNPGAKVMLIEFSDFQCPYCGLYARGTSTLIEKEFVDSGKILYAFRNYPLTEIHPLALKAGQASICAGAQSKFWPMHDLLFADQKALAVDDLQRHAAKLGLDTPAFNTCLEGRSNALREDIAEASRAGVESTPTFVVGVVQSDGNVMAMSKIRGTQPLAVFRKAVEDAMRASASTARAS